jgi:NADPH:quinone reductase
VSFSWRKNVAASREPAKSQASRETMKRLISLAGEWKLKPVIDRELPLERAADAHRAIQARETFGKVILRP